MLAALLLSFAVIFVAELGDKTQLAVIGFTGESASPWVVFGAASAALVVSTGLAVLFGQGLTRVVPVEWLRVGAAALFIVIGAFVMSEALPAALRR